jgi:hypothetical protein
MHLFLSNWWDLCWRLMYYDCHSWIEIDCSLIFIYAWFWVIVLILWVRHSVWYMFYRWDRVQPVLIVSHLTEYDRFLLWILRNHSPLVISTSLSSISPNLYSSTRYAIEKLTTMETHQVSLLSMIDETLGFDPSTLENEICYAYLPSCWTVEL